VGDFNGLKRHINNFVMKNNANINGETLNHLVEICPILRIKSKQSGSKKEILCYDIDILFKELEKIVSYTDKIFLHDISVNIDVIVIKKFRIILDYFFNIIIKNNNKIREFFLDLIVS